MRVNADIWIDADTHIENHAGHAEGWINISPSEDSDQESHTCYATLFIDDTSPKETADKIGELIGALKVQQLRQTQLWNAERARQQEAP